MNGAEMLALGFLILGVSMAAPFGLFLLWEGLRRMARRVSKR